MGKLVRDQLEPELYLLVDDPAEAYLSRFTRNTTSPLSLPTENRRDTVQTSSVQNSGND